VSDSTASLARKISSAGELQSVVRTMKALAASSIGQYEKSVAALGDYNRAVELGLGLCFRKGALVGPGAARKRGAGREPVGAVVFGSSPTLRSRAWRAWAAHRGSGRSASAFTRG